MYLPDLSTFDTNAPRRASRTRTGTTASTAKPGFTVPRGEEFGVLQELVDATFRRSELASNMDLLMQAQTHDVGDDIMEVVELMPPGRYSRDQMCDQMNSIITAHGWGLTYGTVE